MFMAVHSPEVGLGQGLVNLATFQVCIIVSLTT